MRKMVSPAVVVLIVASVALTGCASKEFVQEQIAASEQRTDAKVGEVQSSVEKAQQEISALQAKDADLQKQIADLTHRPHNRK